jgi:SAM-dependent methyltransferase
MTVTDDTALKQRHRSMWASGHYSDVARDLLPRLAERIVEAAGIGPGQRVLDIAAGSGNLSVVAARAGADVVASDLTPELLEQGRAAHPDLPITWETADAEALPYDDGVFDAAISCVGIMFAPHHRAAADEMLRVTRPGGRICVASWTPEGFIGGLFATMRDFVPPPPAGVQPPPLWGKEEHVRELLGEQVTDLELTRERLVVDRFADGPEFRDYFKVNYGPTLMAYRGLAEEPDRVAALDAAIDELVAGADLGGGRMEWEYLLLNATRR